MPTFSAFGIVCSDLPRSWGQRYASLHDPDGTGVDLFAALPAVAE